jgi:hypothetical protein
VIVPGVLVVLGLLVVLGVLVVPEALVVVGALVAVDASVVVGGCVVAGDLVEATPGLELRTVIDAAVGAGPDEDVPSAVLDDRDASEVGAPADGPAEHERTRQAVPTTTTTIDRRMLRTLGHLDSSCYERNGRVVHDE